MLLAPRAQAQLAATVPSSDPAYAAVEEISATLPVRGLIMGQRPWSRRELARVIVAFQAAMQAREHKTATAPVPRRVRLLLDTLSAAYDHDIREIRGQEPPAWLEGSPVRAVTVDALATNSAARIIPPTNGVGKLDAVTNPIVEPNWGRPVAEGGTGSIETMHEMGLGSHLALAAQPRVSWLQPTGQRGYEQMDFQRLYVRTTLANVGVEGGVEEVLWGQAGDRGLLLSANPRPLRALTIANDTAITFPWIFRWLGQARVAATIVDLGRDQNYPGAQLVTYKVSIAPTAVLELGAALMDEMGGVGSPPCSLGCRLADLFPYIGWLRAGSDPLTTNKVAEGELRYRIPEAAGLTLTYEGDIDDFDLRRIRSMLWDNTAHVIGARFDRLTSDGRLGLDLQLHHTPLTLYEHYQYTSGLTYRRAIVGDPLGVNGAAAYGTLIWRKSLLGSFEVSTAIESRDASTYSVRTSDSNGDGWRYLRAVGRPKEQRGRLTIAFDRQIVGAGFGYSGRVGIERVRNYDFAVGVGRTNGLAELTLRRYF